HGVAPRRLVPVGEVGPEGGEVVPGRAEVVVDDVHHYADASRVAGVDESLEAVGAAVGVVRGEQVDAVVAPAAVAGELGHGQQLDGVDAELDEVGQAGDGAVEGALGGERADVELVEHRSGERHAP